MNKQKLKIPTTKNQTSEESEVNTWAEIQIRATKRKDRYQKDGMIEMNILNVHTFNKINMNNFHNYYCIILHTNYVLIGFCFISR